MKHLYPSCRNGFYRFLILSVVSILAYYPFALNATVGVKDHLPNSKNFATSNYGANRVNLFETRVNNADDVFTYTNSTASISSSSSIFPLKNGVTPSAGTYSFTVVSVEARAAAAGAPGYLDFNTSTGKIVPATSDPGIYTITYTPSGGGAALTTTVTILNLPVVRLTSGNASICKGLSTNLTVTVSNLSVNTNAWSLTFSDGSVTPITLTGTGNGTFTTAVSPTSNKTYTLTSFTDGSYSTVNADDIVYDDNSNTLSLAGSATITVNPLPTISAQPSGFNVCLGGSASNLTVTASGTGLTYQWYSNSTNSNIGGTQVSSNGTAATYTPDITSVGTTYYYVVVTNNNGCIVTSTAVPVTVYANTSITSQPVGSNICVGGTLTPLSVVAAGGNGTYTYQWYSNTSNSNNSGEAITNATSASFTPSINLNIAGDKYYYVVVTGNCGSVTSLPTTITVTTPYTPTVSISADKTTI